MADQAIRVAQSDINKKKHGDAQKKLEEALTKCGESNCSLGKKSALWATLGVAQVGQTGKEEKARQSFARALALDGTVVIPDNLRNAEIDRIFAETKEDTQSGQQEGALLPAGSTKAGIGPRAIKANKQQQDAADTQSPSSPGEPIAVGQSWRWEKGGLLVESEKPLSTSAEGQQETEAPIYLRTPLEQGNFETVREWLFASISMTEIGWVPANSVNQRLQNRRERAPELGLYYIKHNHLKGDWFGSIEKIEVGTVLCDLPPCATRASYLRTLDIHLPGPARLIGIGPLLKMETAVFQAEQLMSGELFFEYGGHVRLDTRRLASPNSAIWFDLGYSRRVPMVENGVSTSQALLMMVLSYKHFAMGIAVEQNLDTTIKKANLAEEYNNRMFFLDRAQLFLGGTW